MSVSYWPVVPEARSKAELDAEIRRAPRNSVIQVSEQQLEMLRLQAGQRAMTQQEMNAYEGRFESYDPMEWINNVQRATVHLGPLPRRPRQVVVEQIPQKLLCEKNP